jgi:hypothetical protein
VTKIRKNNLHRYCLITTTINTHYHGNKLFIAINMKEILNSDGQQFFQYHQNEPILTSLSNIKKITTTYGLRNPGSGFGHTENAERLNRLMGSQLSLIE